MRYYAAPSALSCILAIALASFAACGSPDPSSDSSTSDASNRDDGDGDGDSARDDAEASTSDATWADVADAGDATPRDPDAAVGIPKDPGFIDCFDGYRRKVTDGGACCGRFGEEQWFEAWSISGDCHENPYGYPIVVRACDEPADCPSGQTCCIDTSATIVTGSGTFRTWHQRCFDRCPAVTHPGSPSGGGTSEKTYQLCKADDDCPDASPCVVQQCAFLFTPFYQLQTCGGIANEPGGDFLCKAPQ